MKIGKLRHRIIFLKPLKTSTNSMGETVPVWIPFKPTINHNLQTEEGKVCLTRDNAGNAVLVYYDGKPYAHTLALSNFSVWANVTPMTGREYEESQKLRVETTYKISTRFFKGITPEMRILYDNKEFEIVSVLDLNERHAELQIVAIHKDNHTKQDYDGDANE